MTTRAEQTRGGQLPEPSSLLGQVVGWGRLLTGAALAVPREIAATASALPRAVLQLLLDEVLAALARADLTGVLLEAIDFDRLLGALDLQAIVEKLDLNAVVAGIDLNALLANVDLNPLVAGLDLNPVVAALDLNAPVAGLDLNPVVAGLDLNPVVAGLDLQPVIAGIDINAIVGSVDIDEILRRTDIAGVAANVMDEIDLNSIVRDASSSVTTEMITDVRTGSERADDRVEVFVNRLLRRKGGQRLEVAEEVDVADGEFTQVEVVGEVTPQADRSGSAADRPRQDRS